MQRKVDRKTKEGKSSEVELTQAMELEVMALCKIKQCHECKKYGHNIYISNKLFYSSNVVTKNAKQSIYRVVIKCTLELLDH